MTLLGPYQTKAEALAACSSSSSSSKAVICVNCPHANGGTCCPDTWTFTANGIGGTYTVPSPCTSCTVNCGQFNGTMTMTRPFPDTQPCIWRYYPPGSDCTCPNGINPTFWQMDYDSDDGWILKVYGIDGVASGVGILKTAKYIADNPELLDCTGCNVFYLDDSGNQCSGWPDSITVCPSGGGGGGVGMLMAPDLSTEEVEPATTTPQSKKVSVLEAKRLGLVKPCGCKK